MATLQKVREQAKIAIDNADYELASALVRRIQSSFPEDYETVELLGRIHLACDRRDEARELFRGLLKVDPENLIARSSLAVMAEEDGDLADALDQFIRLFEIDNTNRQVAAEIRRLTSRLSDHRRTDPGFSKHAVARRLLREGMYQEAISLFEEALETAPEPVLVALGMAQALWLSRSFEEAGGVAEEILASSPSCLKALAIRAGAAHALGNQDAVPILEKCAILNPGNSVARALFGEVEMVIPPVGLEADLPDEDEILEDSSEYDDSLTDEEESEQQEHIDLPQAEVEGEWVRERIMAEETSLTCQKSREHLDAAWEYRARGQIGPAVDELRAALQLDESLLSEVREIALALVEVAPEDAGARWLVGDLLVLDGQLRQAMRQYLAVINKNRLDREQYGTNTDNREA